MNLSELPGKLIPSVRRNGAKVAGASLLLGLGLVMFKQFYPAARRYLSMEQM